MQRGFLPDRAMLRNIIEVDWVPQTISLPSKKGAILLFDVCAEFPSLNRSYMWDVLSAVGLPVESVNVMRCFYKHNTHFIKVSNSLHAGPGLYAGVLQGCPLSGLLFAICVDVLLHRINRVLGNHELLRAYADDIALVLMDY